MFVDARLRRRKRPDEEFRVAWDFVNDLESSDSIASQAITSSDDADDSDTTSAMIENAEIVGTELRCQIQAGTAGHSYSVLFKATTTDGDVFERVLRVEVAD